MVYHHVPFDEWLDMFLELAILLAEDLNTKASYTTLDVVAGCNVWYHSKQSMFLVHVVWASKFLCLILT